MSSNRAYRDATPFYKVFKQMNNDVFGRLDPKILIPFLRNIMDTLVVHKVVLTDGRCGVIVMHNPFNVFSPLVKIDEEIIDLSQVKNLELDRIISLSHA